MIADSGSTGMQEGSFTAGAADGWRLLSDVTEFLALAGDFLRAAPVTNTVLLTVSDVVRRSGPTAFGPEPAHFGVLTGAGAVVGAFVRTPPLGVRLSPVPRDAAAALAALLAPRHPGIGSCMGATDAAAGFAAGWREATGAGAAVRRERLYRLGELTPPVPAPPGRARTAVAADRELLARWYGEFGEATGGGSGRPAFDWADERIAYGGVVLWELPDGTPAAMAGATRPVAGQVRVAPVYTPKPLRGRGYAGAATAELTARLVAAPAGAILLFTDLANPTSNGLYQRLGYRPVRDFAEYAFDRPGRRAVGARRTRAGSGRGSGGGLA